MKIQPQKKYRTPVYPTRLAVLSDTDLLKKNTPPAWRKTALMIGLAAFFVDHPGWASDETPAVVAPIFEHGEGRGSVGCVMVVPPAFLSEEEALEVIKDELLQAKVELPDQDFNIQGVELYKKSRKSVQEKVGNEMKFVMKDELTSPHPYSCDIANATQRIAIEFVSSTEYFDLGGARSSWTVQSLAFKELAGDLAKKVKENGNNLYYGCFYDPSPIVPVKPIEALHKETKKKVEAIRKRDEMQGNGRRTGPSTEIREIYEAVQKKEKAMVEEAKLESKRLLRLQVKDFTDWLKSQGAI